MRASEAAKLNGFEAARLPSQQTRPAPFDIWIEATYGGVHAQSGSNGHFGLLTLGADYVFNRSFVAGTYLQYDSLRQGFDSGSDYKGSGWMAGSYGAVRLTESLFWSLRGGWGRSSNDISPFGTYIDSFETTRWLASTALSGRFTQGAWTISPEASVAYFQDKSKSYLDSLGVTIPSVTVDVGQLKVGPLISYRYVLPDLIVEPRAGAQLIWNFTSDAKAEGLGALDSAAAGPQGVRGRLETGVRLQTNPGVSLDISGSYDGLGSSNGFNAVSGRAGLIVPLN